MSVEIRIPQLGVSMEEGTLSEWLVADGAFVEAGTPLFSVESDKSTTEVEAPVSGTLEIIGETGSAYPVGTVIGRLD
jgi:pyruvate/2-oxoglutarate dehydrogenase complex dihydrolipoamide acyltransferase (E2) component